MLQIFLALITYIFESEIAQKKKPSYTAGMLLFPSRPWKWYEESRGHRRTPKKLFIYQDFGVYYGPFSCAYPRDWGIQQNQEHGNKAFYTHGILFLGVAGCPSPQVAYNPNNLITLLAY